jgi:hypothetical protein
MTFREFDLTILVADKDMEFTFQGLFSRPQALGIRSIKHQVIPHPEHDGGCRTTGVDFLRRYASKADYGLLIFDWEGSGAKQKSPEELEQELERKLTANGWENRNAVIVIQPELESWVWASSRKVDQVIRWPDFLPGTGTMRDWLVEQGWIHEVTAKPNRPKEAYRAVLQHIRRPVSASIFRELAEKVSFKNCQDRAFLRLRSVLQNWFSAELDKEEITHE